MVQKLEACRLCGGEVKEVLNLGNMAFTGIFPKPGESVPHGRLALALCKGECGLVQLADRFDLNLLYGPNYGYRSGLNAAMVGHLTTVAGNLAKLTNLEAGDVCIDIGSSDGTLLGALPTDAVRIGVDPSAGKFLGFYPEGVVSIPEFFPNARLDTLLGERKAKLVTSIAMFYDLEDPLAFAAKVKDLLAPDGVWYLEQSYLPAMIAQNAYDTICHEHIEYYSIRQMAYIAKKAGLKIVHLGFTETNGGSFEVAFTLPESTYPEARNLASGLLNEVEFNLDDEATYVAFKASIEHTKDTLLTLLSRLPNKPWGFGASTKGNVLLQYCGIGPTALEGIYDINPDKEGCMTPGTNIPITATPPKDATYLVLPWHFRDNILDRHPDTTFIFPLPYVKVDRG